MNEAETAADMKAHAALAAHSSQIAEQFGDGLPYERERVIHETRFYMAQSAETMLEAGKRLIVIKENEPHGEFTEIIQNRLGLNERTARVMMQAAIKYLSPQLESKRQALAVLGKTKLLELMVEDDEDLAALADGGTVAGLTLDEFETMTSREMRTALRDAREEKAALERLNQDKSKKIDDLIKKSRRKRPDPWPEEVAGLKDDLHGLGKVLDEVLGKHLTLIDATELEIDKFADGETNPDAFAGYKTVVHHLGEQIERLCTLAAGLRAEFDTRLSGYVELDKTRILPE